ncbi:c-type cytochrome [Aliarcobacter cryaerophilus]|uniref:Cytochrome C n=1 Tax=Aliarcobacter cryaerophilus TaxID=28198 RepID=A0A2S9TPG5_9BACT|nr:c-type cytochrome [Aliarcobacter cryaerophilus]MDD2974801.1 c-type cytochrome [Aliarcobacter cryaerophilus]PRN00732.1 cytochrome C [Arcobacter cryaerophilus gv. pseudocryaerophilus]
MKKGIAVVATSLLLFVGCTEDKKEAKEQVTPKQEVTQNVEEKAKEVKTEVKVEEKKVEEAKSEEPKQANETASNELNAETLFKTCASCHGLKGEKEALGKSQVITGWDKDRVIKALNGYKDGSYGGVMKNLMKTHVETKTPEQIEVLADYISKLQ